MIWIDKQATFDEAMARIGAQPVIAIDTEADSLHSYFDKVCLIQMSIPGEDFVIDPLAKIDLAKFG
ncbi:MAG TPA: ribonuclease D, partial [Thermoanaerobaculia bacterium]|nr:ribonuclease D [Thermoanaerobaculia bacterium]